MKVLLDGRPIRTPLSGVARYCIGLMEKLHQSPDVDLDVLSQNWCSTNTSLNEVGELLDLLFLNTSKTIPPKLRNVILEFLPASLCWDIAESYDILHETYFANMGVIKGVPKVCTIHDVIPLEFPQYFNYSNRIFSKRNFYRQCYQTDMIVTVSEYTKNKVLEYAPETRNIEVIPCGVRPYDGEFDQSLVCKYRLDEQSYIFYIGNIEPRKNLVAFTKALKLSDNSKSYKFIVAGHLNYVGEGIVHEIREILGDQFIFLGRVSEAEKWTLYHYANLFCFPSLYEGFGIPIIESYLAGCPAIFSNNSSMVELAINDQQMFNAESISDMQLTIDYVLGNPSFVEDLKAEGRLFVSQYSWDVVAQKMTGVYSSLCK